jgi:BirA family biotin operon repressor/biotin-[acetyl-CoA-carboxylase] ligase
MDAARREARGGAAAGTVIIAGEQTAGRGRLKREWISPPGNVAMSIILYPDIANLPYLIMIASLAAVHAIENIGGLKAQVKWPNDILIDGKKVCGILIENEMKGNRPAFSIIGIGINTDLKVNDHPEISATAASLHVKDLRSGIIRSLLTELERLFLILPDGQLIYEAWRDKLATLGKKVRASSGNQVIEGIAESVDESGALIIRGADGAVTKVVAGDVTLRRK